MAIIMTLWIGNGAVLNSSSQWQLKEFRRNYLFFKILLLLTGNFLRTAPLPFHKVSYERSP